jgi:hypothetical protein
MWVVPTVENIPNESYSLVWVGIGGGLLRAGSEQNIASNGTPTYSAWYEVYPQSPVTIAPIETGDTISVTIQEIPGKPGCWNITMTDNNNTLLDENFKVNPDSVSQTTAEFIVERPLLSRGDQVTQLSDFGTVTFSECDTNLCELGSLDTSEVYMTSDGSATGIPLASPGHLSDNRFDVRYGP